MKALWSRAWLLSLTWIGTLGTATRAWACGGCFHQEMPAAEITVVTGHRMAFAVSPNRTVLWDQIQYAGPPADFSWVLPVRPGAYVQASREAWFESLDAVTATRVNPPPLKCAQPNNSPGCDCGFGASSVKSADLGGMEDGNDNGVTVIHQGTVGPYATVTLMSDNGDTLTSWLNDNGYSVPPDIAPVISEYVNEGFDFIALRLLPGAGIDQMKPVRVVTEGPPGPLPLRMVKAGVGDYVDITLYVIGAGRYSLPDLTETTLATDELSWDFSLSRSNYADVREEALSENFGYSYLTTFADRGAFSKRYGDVNGVPFSYLVKSQTGTNTPVYGAYYDLASLYFAQSAADDGVPTVCPSIATALAETRIVGDTPGAELPAAQYVCSSFDDIGAALVGLQPTNVWVNRLELDLPHDALNADCTVTLNASQDPVSNALLAKQFTNRPPACEQPIFQTGLGGTSHREEFAWVGFLGFVAFSRLRRRGR